MLKKITMLSFALINMFELPLLWAGNVTIHVRDGSNAAIVGAKVYAVTQGNRGPDGSNSQVGTTDGSGNVDFTLDGSKHYEVVADKHGKGPTARVQYYSPNHLHLNENASGTHNITLDQTITGRGTIVTDVDNVTTSKFVMGTVRKKSSGTDVAFGACSDDDDDDGDCTITFTNVPPAAANTYEVSVFDPSGLNGTGQGNSAQVSSALAADQTINVPIDLEGGLPPDLSANSGNRPADNQANLQNVSGAIVRGVIEDDDDPSKVIPFGHVEVMIRSYSVEGGTRTFQFRGSPVDQNGRFEFVGLPAQKYFISTGGGCNDSDCYKGFTSTSAFADGSLSYNDFEVTSNEANNNAVKLIHVKLDEAPIGTGVLKVKIRKEVDNVLGAAIPNSSVSLFPDHSNWRTTNPGAPVCGGVDANAVFNPGFTRRNTHSFTGTVVLSSITSGNYTLSIWTPYNNSTNNQGTMYNAGEDATWLWGGGSVRGCEDDAEDDLRLNVNGAVIKVFDIQGNEVGGQIVMESGVPTLTIGVEPTQNNYPNRLQGTFTFPESADLSNDPITVVLNENECGNDGCHSEFAYVGGEGTTAATSFTYGGDLAPLTVPNGTYHLEVRSGYWGIVRTGGNGDDRVTFGNGITSIQRNFTMARAGRVSGTLYKPDGSVFTTGNSTGGDWVSAGINVRCGEGSWAHSQVNQDGTFLIGGILPGECDLIPQIWSNQQGTKYAAPLEPITVTVVAGQDVEKDVKLVDGVSVAPSVTIGQLPAVNLADTDQAGNPKENFEIQMLVAGTPMEGHLVRQILVHEQEDLSFRYVPAGVMTTCGPNWPGGVCPEDMPTGIAGDFYLLRRAGIDGGYHQYMTALAVKKNIVISEEAAAASGNANVLEMPIPVSGMAGTQGITVTGTVVAENIIRERDFLSFGGSFDNFIRYIPLMIAKNAATGEFLGAGLVTPPIDQIDGEGTDSIDAAVAEEDWEAFQDIVGEFDWEYGLRGLPANTEIVLIGTTPNYPPVFRRVTTGADGSTIDWDINWDQLAGSGGTISGTITDSDGDAIASASVVIKAPGSEDKTVVSNASGAYEFPGLAQGPYKITATADGYAPRAKKTVISGEETDDVDFALVDGPGSIVGKVDETTDATRPVQDVTVTAYDDSFNADPANAGVPLALLKTQTNSEGHYELKGLIPGNEYVVSVKAEGRYPQRKMFVATGGEITGLTGTTALTNPANATSPNFRLLLKPLQVDVVIGHNDATSEFEFKILNPQNFEEGTVHYFNSANAFDVSTAIDISNDFDPMPDGSLIGTVADSALSSGITYNLRIDAVPADGSPNVVVTVPFGLGLRQNAIRNIDEEILGDDSEGADGVPGNRVVGGDNTTSIDIDPGTLLPGDDNDLPTAQITTQDPADLGGDTNNLLGNATEITFNEVEFTENPLPFNIPFDASTVEDTSNLALYQFDPNTEEWNLLTDEISVNEEKGTVSGFINLNENIQSQADLPGIFGNVRKASVPGKMAAIRTAKGYRRNPRAMASGSAIFAVGSATAGGVSTTGYKQYNFPNPFNLKTKTVALRGGTSGVGTSIRGTYIVVAPTGSGTVPLKIRIYNVAGDMVREFTTTASAGQYNYTEWDGKNTAGDDVASGVYFATVDAPGSDREKPIKLVVVK